jgi:hypothetical protein
MIFQDIVIEMFLSKQCSTLCLPFMQNTLKTRLKAPICQ